MHGIGPVIAVITPLAGPAATPVIAAPAASRHHDGDAQPVTDAGGDLPRYHIKREPHPKARIMIMDGWRRSTYSFSNGNCVEVRGDPSGIVALRDSKDPGGPVLAFTRAGWDAFIKGVKSGELDGTTPGASASAG